MASPNLTKPSLCEITAADIAAAGGMTSADVEALDVELRRVCGSHPREEEGAEAKVWRDLIKDGILKPNHPFEIHQFIYYSVFASWDVSIRGPPPYWFPSEIHSKHTNLGRIMEVHGPKVLGSLYQDPISSFALFRKFSVEHPEIYWSIVVNELSVIFHEPPKFILDTSDKSKLGGTLFPGAVLNITECCLLPEHSPKKSDESMPIVWRNEGFDNSLLVICH